MVSLAMARASFRNISINVEAYRTVQVGRLCCTGLDAHLQEAICTGVSHVNLWYRLLIPHPPQAAISVDINLDGGNKPRGPFSWSG